VFGLEAGRRVSDVLPTIAYAHVAKAAFGLCSTAEICAGEFDPVEFGKRCGAIAREQLVRYREKAESV
jgi:hypothetical protein